MAESLKPASPAERAVGWVILLVLACVAVGVLVRQYRFDRSIYESSEHYGNVSDEAPDQQLDLTELLPPSVLPLSATEHFTPDSLSDKINGKAEQYLPAGFISLTCRRFHLTNDKEAWAEAFVYDMGQPRSAYAVYSSQRRPGAKTSDLASFAYTSGGAMFIAHGRYYLEIIPASQSELLIQAVAALAENFVRSIPVDAEAPPELDMFPAKGLLPESIELQMTNVFGMEGLDNVFLAKYRWDGQDATAFLSVRLGPAKATELAQLYTEFLVANGATDAGQVATIPEGRCMQLFDTYDLVFSCGNVLAGVHECFSRAQAVALAQQLYQKLSEDSK